MDWKDRPVYGYIMIKKYLNHNEGVVVLGDVHVVDGAVLVPDFHKTGPVVRHVHKVVLTHKQWESYNRSLIEHRIKRLVVFLIEIRL